MEKTPQTRIVGGIARESAGHSPQASKRYEAALDKIRQAKKRSLDGTA